MPSAGKHLRAAERHFGAATQCATQDATRSWAAVAVFYCAHQLVHAVLDGEQNLDATFRHPTSHGTSSTGGLGTSHLVTRLYGAIDVEYKSLFAAGKAVRYNGLAVSADDYEALNDDFLGVAKWAAEKLRKQGRTNLPDWL